MDWHPAQVKAAIEMSGTNLRQLAQKHGYAHINDVLHRPWLAAEKIVADVLGKKPSEIWPSRYKLSRDRALSQTRNERAFKLLGGKRKAKGSRG